MEHNRNPGRRHGAAPSPAPRPELADLERVVLGPAMPGTARHWLLFDAWPAGVLCMESGAFWPLRREPDGRFHLAGEPSRSSW